MLTQQQRIIAEHLETFRRRLEAEDLSVYEMQQREQELVDQFRTAEGQAKEVLEKELGVLSTVIEERMPPPPSPEEMIAYHRSQGEHDQADTLQHGQEVERLRGVVDSLHEQKANLIDNGAPASQIEAMEEKIAEATQAFKEADGWSPVHARQAAARKKREEGAAKESAAAEFKDSSDPAVIAVREQLLEEAQEIYAEAERVGRSPNAPAPEGGDEAAA